MNPTRAADLSPLLLNEPVSYYWMGFLIADGTFYDKAVKLHLSEKDRIHLEEFKTFINYSGNAKTCSVSVMHPEVVPLIKDKFDIRKRKTYNPCDLSRHNHYLLFALIVGFIDGDGNMTNRNGTVSSIRIKLHSSWFEQLKFVESFLYQYTNVNIAKKTNRTRINKNGYAELILSDRFLLAIMKQKCLELKLPIMFRKWDGVEAQYQGRVRTWNGLEEKVIAMKTQGLALKEIAKRLSLKYSQVKYLSSRRNRR